MGAGKLWAVGISGQGDGLVTAAPTPLFDYVGIANVGHGSYFYSYDVTRDGARFLVTRRESDNSPATSAAPLVIVRNWRQLLSGR